MALIRGVSVKLPRMSLRFSLSAFESGLGFRLGGLGFRVWGLGFA